MDKKQNIYGQLSRMLIIAIVVFSLPMNLLSANNSTSSAYQMIPKEDKVKLTLSDETGTYQTIVRYKDKATQNFDSRYDAYFMAGNPTNSVMYSKIENTSFAINTLPVEYQTGVPIIVKSNATDLFTIKYQVTQGIEDYTLLLLDKDLDELYILTGEDSITFSNAETLTIDRFEILHYKKQSITTGTTEENEKSVRIAKTESGTVVNADMAMDAISVYSISGKLIWQSNNSGHSYRIPTDLPTGVAIIAVTVDGRRETLKTVL